jgi:hypothetical protein
MQINRSPKKQPTIQSPSNILSNSKIQTFKKLDRRGSIFNLIKDAKALKNNILELDEEESSSSQESSEKQSDSSVTKSVKKMKLNLQISSKQNKQYPTHKYIENQLPILTTSNQILTEAELVNNRDEYYKRNLSSNNYGRKYARRNFTFRAFEAKNEEEFIQLIGLNDEEKDPLKVIQGKKNGMNLKNDKINISNINKNNFNFLLLKAAHEKAENKKLLAKSKKSRKIDNIKYILSNYKEEISKKSEKIFSFHKKDEFADFLIINFLKEKYPKLMDNSDDKYKNNLSIVSNNKNKNNNNINKRRKIYIIKNSTIIYNSKSIPGFLLEIPSIKEMNQFSSKKRKIIMFQFYEFITKKFQSNNKLNIIFKKDRNIITDFGHLSENDKYIYVSNKSIFEGLLFPLNKNLIHTYFQHFQEKEVDKFYFNESSYDSKSFTDKNDTTKNNDDIYDLFFNKKKEHIKNFKKIKKYNKNKKINLNASFTSGIDSYENDDDKYEYIYYSDNERRKKNIEQNENNIFTKNINDNINLYIQAQNQIYDKKIDALISQLSNKSRKNFYNLKKKYNKATDELIKDYLTEKNMPDKNILKHDTPKKLTYQAIIDAFNLLRVHDKTIDINKFVKTRKGDPLYLPYVEKNIMDNTSKYYFSRAKLDKEYPSTLSYNFPKVVEKGKKYTLSELVKYYTKFKSLLNLWLNMHPFANVAEYGIDFDTFFSCTEDICEEEEIFVKKIFNRINNGTSGILSLEDYVDGLIALNRDVLTEQIEFFLKVFNSKDKTYFNYKEILDISKLSIKRLIKIENKFVVDAVSEDLGGYLADFIFKLCDSKKEKGIKIKKLKDVLKNDKENGEFLKLFMCFFGDNKYESKVKNIMNDKKYIKKYRESIRLSFINHLNNLNY